MRLQRRAVAVVLVVFASLLAVPGIGMAAPLVEPVREQPAPGVYIEVLPRMELLAGVQSQTSWVNERGPSGTGNDYYRSLKNFFSEYHNDRAVELSQSLTDHGFTYDAPPHFALRLGPLPVLERPADYGDYLVGRARGEKALEDFRIALGQLAEKSGFASFFDAHRSDYRQYISTTLHGFEAEKLIEWLREFYGWSGGEYHIVLAPAMFPGGGYGATVPLANGSKAIYEILRATGRSEGAPSFGQGANLEHLALHEWGHSFVNPSLEAYPDRIAELTPLFTVVKGTMAKQAYGAPLTFFNEQVLRAATALAVRDLYGEDEFQAEITGNTRSGFYLTVYTVDQLEYYQAHRDQYPRFDQFVPYLLDQYQNDMNQLTASYKAQSRRIYVVVAVLLAIAVLVWRVGQRLRE